MRFLRATVVAVVAFCGACSTDSATLQVELITGLVAGPEFAEVQTEVLERCTQSNSDCRVAASTARARLGLDFSHGRPVASFDLPAGEYRIRVRLARADGALVVERVVALQLLSDTVLPVHVTRDCVGVACPSPFGDAQLSTCLAGQCVDPRCTPAAPQYCPSIDFCGDASECGAVSACAMPGCEEGVCIAAPVVNACASDEWCNPDVGAGCVPFEVVPNTGPVCGSICTLPSEPCLVGYWNCETSAPAFCDDLVGRPVGLSCGAGRICDATGECVLEVTELPAVVVTPTAGLMTSEAGSRAMFSVVLATMPAADVSIGIASSDTGEGTVDVSSIVFTSSNWSVPQAVFVQGVDDVVVDGNVAYTVILASTESSAPEYDGIDPTDVHVTNVDDETANLVVTPTEGLFTGEDGASATFEIFLASEPASDVTISLSSSDEGEGLVSPSTLTFSADDFATARTVTLVGVNDAVADGDSDFYVTVHVEDGSEASYAALDDVDVHALNVDDDGVGVVVSPTSGLVTTEVGGTASFSVVLVSEPTAPVHIDLASSNALEGVPSPATLTFTALTWNIPQSVTVTGVNDHVVDAAVSYSILTSAAVSSDANYNELPIDDVALTNQGAFAQEGYVKASNTGAGDSFGFTLALSADGTTLAIGASGEASSAMGVGGNEADNSAGQSGAVYVFTRVAGVWTQQAYIKASNTESIDGFGFSVDLAADGDTLAVGAYQESSAAVGVDGDQASNAANQAGAVYVFTRSAGVWSQEAYVKASNPGAIDKFGVDVALSATGDTLAVGAYREDSSATGVDGDGADNSAVDSGAVYVFARVASTWSQQAYLKAGNTDASDVFGFSIDLSANGDTLAVGARYEASSAVGVNGDALDNSALGAGAAYVFTRVAAVWLQEAYIKASNTGAIDDFGVSVALSGDGNTLAVGAFSEDSNATGINGDQLNNGASAAGAVYVFGRMMGTWSQEAYVKASNAQANDNFGLGLALSETGDQLVATAFAEGSIASGIGGDQLNNSLPISGAAYTFTRSAGTWTQAHYVKASNPGSGDLFGFSAAISDDGSTIVIGAPSEGSNATGIGGDQTNNSLSNAGAVYVLYGG